MHVFNIGTFNVLDPDFAEKHKQQEGLNSVGKSNWLARKDLVIQEINNANLDIICLQEVSQKTFIDLKILEKSGYSCKHVQHSSRSDGLAIYFKKNKFKEKKFVVISSKEGMNSFYIDLESTHTKKMLRIANTHLLGGKKQEEGKSQIDELVKEMASPSQCRFNAKIIMGDFNSDEKQLVVQRSKFDTLKANKYNFDQDLSPTEIGKGRHIDWIWVQSSKAELESIQNNNLGSVASDHRILATKIKFKIKFKHNQPKNSFRAKIMKNFSGADDKQCSIEKGLDNILTMHANSTPFLPTVLKDYQAHVDQLNIPPEKKKNLVEFFQNAVINSGGKI
ncbi:MAG: endonuclease/exonuclease/phosphatase family protein [Candidatus Protochlamydia sp.]|nr:endonuclease/exonuclease/phosphatase family protein [Candidatus Protochlamydia sp.]